MMWAFGPESAINGAPGARQLGQAFLRQLFLAAVELCATLG
jgi:hypothetical protein